MAADLGFPPAGSGIVPSDSSFPPTVTGVVPTESYFPPSTSTVSAEPSVLLTPQPLAEPSPGVEQGAVGIRPLVPTPSMQAPNMSVFTDVELMDGHDETNYTDFFPPALNPAEAQALEEIDKHTLLTGSVGTAASILAPGKRSFTVGKPEKVIDINHFHASSGHQHERLLRQTAQQHGVTLMGVLQPCGGCLEAKRIRAGTPRRTTSRAGRPMETVHIDLSGPYEASLGGSVYLIMFVDSASRWMRPYGMRRKCETTAYVQTFLADMNGMGRPNCFRTDNGGEFISRDYVDYCDSAGIRREYTAPGKPQQNAIVKSAIWRAMKGGHAARLEIGRLFPDVDLGKIPFVGANSNRLWLEAALWASDCFNRSATKANTGWRSPHEVFFGRLPDPPVIPFFHPGMMRVDRSTKSDAQAVKCFYLNNGHNHSSSTVKVLKRFTGGVCYYSDIAWMVPRTPVLPLPPPAGAGSSVGSEDAAAPTTTPGFTITYAPPSLRRRHSR